METNHAVSDVTSHSPCASAAMRKATETQLLVSECGFMTSAALFCLAVSGLWSPSGPTTNCRTCQKCFSPSTKENRWGFRLRYGVNGWLKVILTLTTLDLGSWLQKSKAWGQAQSHSLPLDCNHPLRVALSWILSLFGTKPRVNQC